MTEDPELLRLYVHEKSQAAFAELVKRYINLVYAGALRRLGGDTHLAEDATQRVFMALAAAAGKLCRRPVLAGWLHVATRNVAVQIVRSERRRSAREQKAQAGHPTESPDPARAADWDRLRPIIDSVLDELDEDDREAVILRFFEGQSHAEIGARLRLKENTARMRVERALERMQRSLVRRGVTSTGAALTLALANQAGIAAPPGLAATVSSAALAHAATVATGFTLLTTMSTSKAVLGAVALAGALTIGTRYHQEQANRRTVAALRAERDTLAARSGELERALEDERSRREEADRDSALLLAEIERLKTAPVRDNVPVVTHASVQARYRRAQELERNGNWEEALAEYLWCYDEGMLRIASFTGVRNSFLVRAIGRLAERYPAAKTALEARRDAAGKRLLASANEYDAALDYAALNQALHDDAKTQAAFDTLPPGDPRRRSLLMLGGIFDRLVSARRYAEVVATRSYEQMKQEFVLMTTDRPVSEGISPDRMKMIQQANRTHAVTVAARDIEVLAGAGRLDEARAMASQLLGYDASPASRATVEERLARAGYPTLLNDTGRP